ALARGAGGLRPTGIGGGPGLDRGQHIEREGRVDRGIAVGAGAFPIREREPRLVAALIVGQRPLELLAPAFELEALLADRAGEAERLLIGRAREIRVVAEQRE